MRGTITSLVVAGLAVAGCSLLGSSSEPSPVPGEPTTTSVATAPSVPTTTPRRECLPATDPLPTSIDGEDMVVASVDISMAVFSCADRVALAPYGDVDAITRAALNLNGSGPVLVVDGPVEPATKAELVRLDPRQIIDFGVSLDGITDMTAEIVSAPSSGFVPHQPLRWRSSDPAGHVWLVGSPEMAALAWTAARATGASVIPLPDGDLLSDTSLASLVRSAAGVTVAAAGGIGWQLDALLEADELPGGGFTFFPGKRLIALYGNPSTPFLGVLGEQPPAEGLARLEELAQGYDADGLTVVPTFEIIATVASARAGQDNDYSDEMAISTLRPWVEFASEHGVYVVLDLQPGRTDFLTQAKYYEDLLRLPHVGLALDPEWRIGPDQVHLRQVGTVDASEVNRVSEWLAGIVREETLPQKLFIVHQFKHSMITNRELIETPSELAVVIQMDGQGPLPSKYGTFRNITAQTEGVGWRWGWKNFFDEDDPMATPAEVLRVDPVVVFVSFQ